MKIPPISLNTVTTVTDAADAFLLFRHMRFLLVIFLLAAIAHTSCDGKNPRPEVQKEPLEKLLDGNKRFISGRPAHPDETKMRIRNLKKGQRPFAAVISCSDSRVPPELVFDQGFGDIFSIRTAGNIIGDYELGSIEYAVEHLGCSLVVVMGHENCGAVDAFLKRDSTLVSHDHIANLMDYIANEKEAKELPDSQRYQIDHAVKANIRHGVNLLKQSEPVLKEKFSSGKIQIVGAMYDLDNGKVELLKQ
jgi:carbonic anhydrase